MLHLVILRRLNVLLITHSSSYSWLMTLTRRSITNSSESRWERIGHLHLYNLPVNKMNSASIYSCLLLLPQNLLQFPHLCKDSIYVNKETIVRCLIEIEEIIAFNGQISCTHAGQLPIMDDALKGCAIWHCLIFYFFMSKTIFYLCPSYQNSRLSRFEDNGGCFLLRPKLRQAFVQ